MNQVGKFKQWVSQAYRLSSVVARTGTAVVAAGAMLATGIPAAFAGGGGGSDDGGGTRPMDTVVSWAYRDNNDGAFGSGDDLNSIYAAFASMGVSMARGGEPKAQKAMNEANSNCLARFNEAHPDQYGEGKCRIVSVGTMTGHDLQFSGDVHHTKEDWMNKWAAGPANGTYSNHGSMYKTYDVFFDQPDTSVDSLVEAYASDSATIIVIALNQYEPKPADIPPAPPSKDVPEGTNADAMRHPQVITTGTGFGGKQIAITDVIEPHGQDYVVDAQKVTDKTTGEDISNQFTFDTPNGSKPANDRVTATWKNGNIPNDHEFVYSLDVVTSNPNIDQITDHGSVYWKGSVKEVTQDTPNKEFPTWAPNPDKSWVLWDKTTKQWKTVIDPSKSNTTGADDHVFMDGDKVAGVVNGTVEQHLIEAPKTFSLTDDWSKADYLVDQDGKNTIRVYESVAEPGEDGRYRQSSINDIAATGRDVTDQFTITVTGTSSTAVAKPEYVAKLKNMDKPLQVTLLTPFTVNFANGKGAAQVRKDQGKKPGDEVTFCSPTAGDGPQFINQGSQTVNNQVVPTNTPKICGYVPPVKKDVVSESSQGGDQDSVDGKVVFPGEKLEYQLTTQPVLPHLLAYQRDRVVFTDRYNQYLKVDKQTLEIMDLSTGKVIPKSKYKTIWDDDAHMVQVVLTDTELISQWRADSNPRIQIRFEGTVDKNAPANLKVNNQWMLTLDNALTSSNEVFNVPPTVEPVKKDVSSKDKSISIDGKTLLLGDTGVYRVTIDAKQLDTAYKVWKLGVVDDFDEEYLSIDPSKIELVGADGKDYTKAFNIQVVDGVVYAFAKRVDTLIPATGETVKGDPQPTDLKAYAQSDQYDPLHDPAIDQRLLGSSYELLLPYKVIKVADGKVVKNKATQVTNRVRTDTNTVSNPLKPINPSKDVVISLGGDSVNGKSIYKNKLFLYKLESPILPANRAYSDVTAWHGVDPLNPAVDQYTGQWAVYASRDLYRDGKLIAATGTRIAGSGFDSSQFGGDLFTLTYEQSGKVTIDSTDLYRKIVSASGDREVGWTAYIQCKRIAETDRQDNQWTVYYNDKVLPSNVVWTRTPDMTPSIHVEKFDTASGWPNGDRDTPQEALQMNGDSQNITIRITNTSGIDPDTGKGAVYRAKDIPIIDNTIAGDGTLVDLRYPDNWDTLILKPGEHVDVFGVVRGVTSHHTDRVKVTGIPLTPCVVPTDDSKPFDPKDPASSTTTKPEFKDAIMVDGVPMCGDTRIESNQDDWNAVVEPLAVTGSSVVSTILAAVLLVSAGGAIVLGRRTGVLSSSK